MKKRYGSTKTHLTLTAKAEDFYIGTWPMDIYEYATEKGYRYTFCLLDDAESELMTEERLNQELESLYDLYWSEGEV